MDNGLLALLVSKVKLDKYLFSKLIAFIYLASSLAETKAADETDVYCPPYLLRPEPRSSYSFYCCCC